MAGWLMKSARLPLLLVSLLQACADTKAVAKDCQANEDCSGLAVEGDVASMLQTAVAGAQLQTPFVQRTPLPDIVATRAEAKVPVDELEAFADMNLLLLANQSCTKSGITREAWADAFSKLDMDNNGVISGGELRTLEQRVLPTSGRNLTKHDFNLTMANIRAGMALLTSAFPDDAPRLVEHEAVIVSLAYQGALAPKDSPVPQEPLGGLLRLPRSRSNASFVSIGQNTQSPECVAAVLKMTVGVLGLLFGLIGVSLPGDAGKVLGELFTEKGWVLEALIDAAGSVSSADGDGGVAALAVKDVFMILYDEGIFMDMVKESLASLSWWDYAVMAAQVAAVVASWAASAGMALAAQIALALVDCVEIFEGARMIPSACQSS